MGALTQVRTSKVMLDSTLINKTVQTVGGGREGTVVAVHEGYCIIEDCDGFPWRINEGDFVVVDVEERNRQYGRLSQSKPSRKKESKAVVCKHDVIRNDIVVDLHEYSKGHDSAAILQRQLGAVRATLDSYKGKHGVKIVFIHGSGVEDRLRNEIMKLLESQKRNFDYQEAPSDKYKYHTAIKVAVK